MAASAMVYPSGTIWRAYVQPSVGLREEHGYQTQAEGMTWARKRLRELGGGELTIVGRNGIREKDTVPPGNDPRWIKG